jgi:hypothetical protein
VDENLGTVQISRVVSAVAAGRILNPKTARSQILGGRGVRANERDGGRGFHPADSGERGRPRSITLSVTNADVADVFNAVLAGAISITPSLTKGPYWSRREVSTKPRSVFESVQTRG